MTTIERITLGGFRNIECVSLDLQNITSILAPNNYGKSNVLDAIVFGFEFLKSTPEDRQDMMGNASCISINKYNDKMPFVFNIEGIIDSIRFRYEYRFIWDKFRNADDTREPGFLTNEIFEYKSTLGEKPKFTKYIDRKNPEKATYIACETGRCNKEINVEKNELAIVKLSNYDDLFYHHIIESLLSIKIRGLNTLSNPAAHFAPRLRIMDGKGSVVIGDRLPQYLYDLSVKDNDAFEYLISATTNLIPSVESVIPQKLSVQSDELGENAPFEKPQYDVFVKEKNNNQRTRFQYLSTGCMKILYLLCGIFRAQRENTQLIIMEELENSIHPKLLESLLTTIEDFLGDTKLIFTSHSPNLAQYLGPKQIYVGLPSDNSLIDLRTIKSTKIRSILQLADLMDMNLGEYLFELMLDAEKDRELIDFYFNPQKTINYDKEER